MEVSTVRLQQPFQLLTGHADLTQDVRERAGRQLSSVDRNDRTPRLARVLEDVVAALHAMDEPPVALQRANECERVDRTRSATHEPAVTATR